MWLMSKPLNLLYSLPHHCAHMFRSFIILSFTIIPPFFPVFDQFLLVTLFVFSPLCIPLRLYWLLSFYLRLIYFLHHRHHHRSLHRSSLNPVELVSPPPLLSVSCRAPVTPSGVTRTVSDSPRTCYLVTRL